MIMLLRILFFGTFFNYETPLYYATKTNVSKIEIDLAKEIIRKMSKTDEEI